jgi:hypothetical protein
MTQNNATAKAKTRIDWLTVIAIAAIAISLTQFIHEGMHALTCLVSGAELEEFSALHVSCRTVTVLQEQLVAGSASLTNLVVGLFLLTILRLSAHRSSESKLFLWLFMVLNWLLGSSYWLFSGVANIGDWAVVISGWQPVWAWRLGMALLGTGLYTYLIWLSLHELGKIIGGDEFNDQIGRAVKIGILAYITVFGVIFSAGVFNPYGLGGLPAVAGIFLALGGMSPLLWMTQWFRAESFLKISGAPLEINRQWIWFAAGAAVVFFYVFILGKSWYF